MVYRCTNKNGRQYKDYGGRGIAVCARWMTFENFYADMGDRPHGTSLDRIDNDRGYEPGNCRWATASEQTNNRRSSAMLTVDGRSQTETQWARETGVPLHTISKRIKSGWTAEDAVKTPPRKLPAYRKRKHELLQIDGVVRTLGEWSELAGLKWDSVMWRLKSGWSTERAVTTPADSRLYVRR